MRTLYFIRHAESEANKQRIFGSRLQVPLTPAGRADAARIAGEFREITELSGIISSPLRRAMETARAFSDLFGCPVVPDERLAEQDLGPFTGMSYDAVKTMKEFEPDPLKRWNWHPGGSGESYSMVADRVVDFLGSVSDFPAEGSWLMVTHAVFFRLLRGALENTLPEYPAKFPNNGEIWKVEFHGLGERHTIHSILLGNSRSFTHNP